MAASTRAMVSSVAIDVASQTISRMKDSAALVVGMIERSSSFSRQSFQVSRVRSRTALPRSSTSGRKPICARISAAKMPAGPKPTTTGREVSPDGAWATK